MSYIDPRLSRHLHNAYEDMLIDAIFVIADHEQNPSKKLEDNELIKQVLQDIINQTDEQPSFVRIIPRANAIALTAHPKLIHAFVNHSWVQVASSATIDPFHFS